MVGTNDLEKGFTYYEAAKVVIHDSGDVAMVRVSGSIKFNDKVKPIEYSPDEVPDGTELQFIGWERVGLIFILS